MNIEIKGIKNLRIRETVDETIVLGTKTIYNKSTATTAEFSILNEKAPDDSIQVFEIFNSFFLIDQVSSNEKKTTYECIEITIPEAR